MAQGFHVAQGFSQNYTDTLSRTNSMTVIYSSIAIAAQDGLKMRPFDV